MTLVSKLAFGEFSYAWHSPSKRGLLFAKGYNDRILLRRGQLLILAPWEHHNKRLTIKRGQCLQLNDMAKAICEGPA